MGYVKARFDGIKATDDDIAKILLEISGFGGKGTLRRMPGITRMINGFFSENAKEPLENPDFIITSILVDGKLNSRYNQTIEYNPETISSIYISALEERLMRDKKL